MPLPNDEVGRWASECMDGHELWLTQCENLGYEPDTHLYEDGTRTSQDAANQLGCEVAHIAKSIVFAGQEGAIVVITSGANRVDRKRKLKRLLGYKPSMTDADYILESFRALEGAQFEFYGNYYNAQAMFQLGGKYWETYADWMYETYLKKQKDDGSWYSREAGQVYGTAMMTLAFTVPYRQLPIYQRDETVDEE